jgi:hypothetical protein
VAAPAIRTTSRAVEHGASTPARFHPTLTESRLAKTCVETGSSSRDAGVGGAGCAPGTDPGSRIYVNAALPDNPTGIREVGVESDKIDCAVLPDTPATTCTAAPSTGGNR